MRKFFAKLINWGRGREFSQRMAYKEQILKDIERSINALEQQPTPVEINHKTKQQQVDSQKAPLEKEKNKIAA